MIFRFVFELAQAIFSDDSDEEEVISANKEEEDPEKKAEVANTALSRLMAGDFLESLGKELGLEVPPDPPYSSNKPVETVDIKSANNRRSNDADHRIAQGGGLREKDETTHGSEVKSDRVWDKHNRGGGSSSEDDERSRSRSGRHRRRRNSSSDSDSYSDDRDRHRSRSSKSKRKRHKSSREKSSSDRKRYDKDHEHRSRDSRSESRRDKHRKRS